MFVIRMIKLVEFPESDLQSTNLRAFHILISWVADYEFAHSELAREKMWSRIHLIPMLQAEEDRDLVRRHWADQAREKELMGTHTKVYNSDRYVSRLLRRPTAEGRFDCGELYIDMSERKHSRWR